MRVDVDNEGGYAYKYVREGSTGEISAFLSILLWTYNYSKTIFKKRRGERDKLSLSLPCEDTVWRLLSTNHGEDPHKSQPAAP